jgi:predicted anti-sigma-YlaC factor YlaD
MNCETVRAALRERFDSGQTLDTGLEFHLASCVRCRELRERLASLNECLAALPIESPGAGFAARVSAQVAEAEQRRRRNERMLQGGAVALAVAGALALGWFYPVELRPREWLYSASAWLPEVGPLDWRGVVDGAAGTATNALAWAREGLERVAKVPPSLAWPGLAVSVSVLLILNTVEAIRASGSKGGS